eukprot:TRINITY_DN135_c0_g1_i1.p1 TRINITY_DN135_c0_g1~~TRINITY_DN135_c0_g1_i1.p1  ORF type:complete len:184 (-),score=39.61 TRINITY_DN135_c0_g1_i1:374-925(-)
MVLEVLSAAEFSKHINGSGNKLVVVDYSAAWCGPCKQISPYVEELALRHVDVVFLTVDVDKVPAVAKEQKISAMPTFQFFKNGNSIASFTGADRTSLNQHVMKLKGPQVTSTEGLDLPQGMSVKDNITLTLLNIAIIVTFIYGANTIYRAFEPTGKYSWVVSIITVLLSRQILSVGQKMFRGE